MPVLSQQQIIRAFGNPFPMVRRDGTISPRWEEKIISYARLPARLPLSWNRRQHATRLKCHYKLVSHFTEALRRAHDDAAVWATIGDTGGIYEWRAMRTGKALSFHAWGVAIDLDVRDNPQGDATPDVHPRLIEIFESVGFAWGGRFGSTRIDAQHFQFNDLAML